MLKRGYHDFPLSFSLTKKFVGKSFGVSEKLRYRKLFMHKKGRGYHDFPSEIFCLPVPKHFVRGTLLCFRKFRVSKNFMPKRGISRFSVENLLSRSTEKLRKGTLLCSVSENFR